MFSRGGGSDAVPKLDPLTQTLQRLRQILAPHVARPPDAPNKPAESQAASPSRAPEVGAITSRQDVVRALDAVVTYYRNSEPGSLVPVIAERAKRLVSMSFIEALAEIAPEALEPVKKAAGVRE
jgi:type VI secretion system protein ImpA